MEIKKNRNLIQRKQFLIRGLANNNISQEQYDREMPKLEAEITSNLKEALAEAHEKLKENITKIKTEVKTDGDLKRNIARFLITLLEDHLDNTEIKGVMRQGYKIMRARG